MVNLVNQTIEMLKEKINSNLARVQTNELAFRQILAEADSGNKEEMLHDILEQNKNLLAENFDLINVQISLVKFVEKYKFTETAKEELPDEVDFEEESPIDYFGFTISGKMPFNQDHPKYCDDEFFSHLIKYYQDREEYEKCADLLKTRNNI